MYRVTASRRRSKRICSIYIVICRFHLEPGMHMLDPTCVTPVQAVRNGPGVMPGAVAVEDELGRVISLATFTPEVGGSVLHGHSCGF